MRRIKIKIFHKANWNPWDLKRTVQKKCCMDNNKNLFMRDVLKFI